MRFPQHRKMRQVAVVFSERWQRSLETERTDRQPEEETDTEMRIAVDLKLSGIRDRLYIFQVLWKKDCRPVWCGGNWWSGVWAVQIKFTRTHTVLIQLKLLTTRHCRKVYSQPQWWEWHDFGHNTWKKKISILLEIQITKTRSQPRSQITSGSP